MAARRKRGGWLLRVFDLLMLVLTLAVALALLLAYFAPRVDPNDVIWFAFLGLAAPFLYIGNLLLMLYWVVRWRPIGFLSLIVLIAGWGYVSRYLKINLKQQYEAVQPTGENLRVMSYNVGGFWGGRGNHQSNHMGEITKYIREEKPDILCMQEFEVNHINTQARFDSLVQVLPNQAIHFTYKFSEGGLGLAIYSRHRILRSGQIRFEATRNSAMWADLVVGRDTVRVFNCHLQTTGVDESDREFLRPEIMVPDSLHFDRSMGIARKLARNYRQRAVQADTMALHIHDGTPRVIVCGDFNDTPMSYVYQRIRGDFDDTFQEKGQGMAATYRGMRGLFRIDYIFSSVAFRTVGYHSTPLTASDHNPVTADFVRRGE